MNRQITVQLFSLREALASDLEGTLKAVADMGFPCVETAGYQDRSPKEYASVLSDLGLTAPTGHTPLPVGDKANEVIETALELGHRYLITGSPPGGRDQYVTRADVLRTARLYSEAADNAAKHGLMVGYHNHDWDLAKIDEQRAHQIFLENTPETVLWEADLFWVARAGLDPVEFLEFIGPRGRALHFKDGHIKDREIKIPYLPAGQGDIDLKTASEAAKHAEFIGVELDNYPGDMLEAVRQSYTYLTESGIAQGNK